MPASSATVAAIEQLVERVPELRPEWDEHVRFFAEPLPHVFFGDVCRFALRVAESRDDALLARLAGALESIAASDDPQVENVVAVSFVEHFVLGDAADLMALEKLRAHAGPALLALVKSYERGADR